MRARALRSVIAAAVVGLTVAATGPAGAEATDPGLAQQWGLRQIGAPTAWETSVGTGVPIAIIDTGIDLDHEDLRGQLMARVTCVGTGGDARRCAVDGADIHGHGTHVAGIAVAASNNAGVVGVAPGARLVAVRVFQEERSTDALSGKETVSYFADSRDIDAGIRWVLANVSQKGAINLSLSNELPVKVIDTGFEDGIEQAWAAGWVPVLSAGNESNLAGVNGEEYGDLNAMVVGATGPDGSVASYSSPLGSAKWGLVAPGGNARAAGDKSACENEPDRCVLSDYVGGRYGFLQGTSMAAPHVAGAVALLMAAGLTNAQAVQRLLATADTSKSCGSGCKGRLDVAKAVAGLPPAGGGGAATTAPTGGGAPAASGSPAAPGPTTTARRSPGPKGTTATTSAPAPPEGAAPTPIEAPTTAPPVTAEDPGLTDVSIEAAAQAVDDAEDDGPPLALVVAGAAALLLVAVGTGVVARRRAR